MQPPPEKRINRAPPAKAVSATMPDGTAASDEKARASFDRADSTCWASIERLSGCKRRPRSACKAARPKPSCKGWLAGAAMAVGSTAKGAAEVSGAALAGELAWLGWSLLCSIFCSIRWPILPSGLPRFLPSSARCSAPFTLGASRGGGIGGRITACSASGNHRTTTRCSGAAFVAALPGSNRSACSAHHPNAQCKVNDSNTAVLTEPSRSVTGPVHQQIAWLAV